MNAAAVANDTRRGAHTRLPLPRNTLAGFVLAVLAVIFIGVVSYQSLVSRRSSAELVTHTLQVMEQLQALLSTMKDAETGQRGYLLTNIESYLEPYNNARAEYEGEITKLRELQADNSAQLQRLSTLEKFSTDKMTELAQTIEQHRAGDAAVALAVVKTNRGRAAMDHIRTVVAQMQVA